MFAFILPSPWSLHLSFLLKQTNKKSKYIDKLLPSRNYMQSKFLGYYYVSAYHVEVFHIWFNFPMDLFYSRIFENWTSQVGIPFDMRFLGTYHYCQTSPVILGTLGLFHSSFRKQQGRWPCKGSETIVQESAKELLTSENRYNIFWNPACPATQCLGNSGCQYRVHLRK